MPAKMSGAALGSDTFRKICSREARKDLINRMLSLGTFSRPTIVLISTGKKPMAIAITTLELCP